MMCWAIGEILGINTWGRIAFVIAGLVLLGGCERAVIRRWRAHKELPAYLRKNLSPILRVELDEASITTSQHSTGTMFRPGPPKKIRIQAAGMPPMEGDVAKRVLSITGDLAGDTYILDAKKAKPGKRIVLVKKPAEKKIDLTPGRRLNRPSLRVPATFSLRRSRKPNARGMKTMTETTYLA